MVLTAEEDLPLEGVGRHLPSPVWLQLSNRTRSVRPTENGEEEQRNLEGVCLTVERSVGPGTPPLDKKEMIKIFVDALKNP